MMAPLCFLILFFFNDTATTEIYTLSLHDALPILGSKSTLFRTGVAAIADYIVQIILGVVALGLNGYVVVVHLTNAFVLGVLVTYLISFADSADKISAHVLSQLKPAST